MNVRRKTIWRFSLTLLGGAILFSCNTVSSPEPNAERLRVKRVVSATVEAATSSRELRFSGVTRAKQRARLSFTQAGRIVVRPISIGDRVVVGQVLARLDDHENQNSVTASAAAVTELQARCDLAEREATRIKKLASVSSATPAAVEAATASLAALRASETLARAHLQEARRRLAESQLVAPFAGIVTDQLVEPGEVVGVGMPVVDLLGDGIEVEVEIPESIVTRIHRGDSAHINLPLAGYDVAGTVRSVSRATTRVGKLFPVIVDLGKSPEIVAGMTAELLLRVESEGVIVVPVEAVIDPGGRRPSVFRLRDGGDSLRAEKVVVSVGMLIGERVVVEGPLAIGERIVVVGQRGLLDGEVVEVMDTEGTP